MLRLSLLLLLSHPASCMLLGWVESPGYPSGYQPHASMNWSRCAPKGYTLSIRIVHLDLEDSQDCENDAVKIFSKGNLISVLCGQRDFEELQSVVNPLLSSPGGCLSLSFHSDYSNIKRHGGFRGFYTVQDFDECEDDSENGCSQFCHNFLGGYRCSCRHGYHLNTDKHTCSVSCGADLSGLIRGSISSPSWPGSYQEDADCRYTLSVEAHLQLELHFSGAFDVEQSPDGQCVDALRIETPSGIIGPFCGDAPPLTPILTHSHLINVSFTSDGFGTNKGFTLHFKTRGKVCPAAVTSRSTVNPQKPEYHADHTVTVTCDLGHVVNSQGLLTLSSQYETTCLSTGVWAPSFPCEPVNCGLPDIPEDGILQLAEKKSNTQYKDQILLKCSSKYYRLEGNDTYACSAAGKWVSGGGSSQMPKCNPVCGVRDRPPASAGRILGGRDAKLGQIPWQLLIKAPYRGGATLINDQWAVTAAHVVETLKETSMLLYGGLVNGMKTSDGSADVVVMESERIIIHPGYIRSNFPLERTSYDNDIALIRLTSRVNFGPHLLPICLPGVNRGLEENDRGTVSGWGLTEGRGGLVTSRMLKYAEIGVYSLSECQKTPHTSTGSSLLFTENMFCAGASGKDSCQKDSGGPFFVPPLSAGTGPYHLVGVVSWGPPCEEEEFKGYYTKVENYVPWIKETIDKVENSQNRGRRR